MTYLKFALTLYQFVIKYCEFCITPYQKAMNHAACVVMQGCSMMHYFKFVMTYLKFVITLFQFVITF